MRRSRTPKEAPKPRARFARLAPLAVFVITAAVFIPSLFNSFTNWDDSVYVHSNPLLRGTTLNEALLVLTRPYYSEFAPVLHLSYGLDYLLAGRTFSPWAFHLSCVLIHAANAALACLLVHRLTGSAVAGAAAGLIFGIHPAQVEAVSWVSQKKTLLATCFFLISLVLYLRWRRGGRRWAYAASLIAFLAALCSKQSVVVLPVFLLLYELMLREAGQPRGRRWVATIPFFALVPFGVGVGWYGQWKGGALGVPPGGGGILPYFATMLPVVWRYVLLMLLPGFPVHPNALHGPPHFATLLAAEPAAALLATLAALALLALWRNRWALFWSAWFVVGLSPMLNVIPLRILMAERYLYIPAMAFGALGGHLAAWLAAQGSRSRLSRVAACGLAGAVAVMLGAVALHRQPVWRHSGALWRDTLLRSPTATTPRADLGEWYIQHDLKDKAEQQFQLALIINPNEATSLVNLAKIVAERGKYPEAKRLFERALEHAETRFTLATAYLGLGLIYQKHYRDPREELKYLELSLTYDPYQDQAGKMQERVQLLRKQLGLGPPGAAIDR